MIKTIKRIAGNLFGVRKDVKAYTLDKIVRLEKNVINQVKDTIEKYHMIEKDEVIAVAFSGGKDSIVLLEVLKKLGYQNQVVPLIVDMGYTKFPADKVTETAKAIGYDPVVINVRDKKFLNKIDKVARKEIEDNFKFLDNLNENQKDKTPCTTCYNTKMLAMGIVMDALENTEKMNLGGKKITKLAFGHHATDLIGSYLKSAFQAYEWDKLKRPYDRDAHNELIKQHTKDFTNGLEHFKNTEICEFIHEYAGKQLVGTDEPPVEPKKGDIDNVKIIRPLAGVVEEDIKKLVRLYEIKDNIDKQPSGCGHALSLTLYTSRDMVQLYLIKEFMKTEGGREIHDYIFDLAQEGIKEDGTLIYRARNKRPEWYKAGKKR